MDLFVRVSNKVAVDMLLSKMIDLKILDSLDEIEALKNYGEYLGIAFQIKDDILDYVKKNPIRVVAGTAGNDEHSVGIREVLDIKHGGIEKYGVKYEYLGTSVPIEKFVDAAIETKSQVIMMSTIISHDDIHYKNMQKLHEYAIEKGVRDKLILIAGGTQVTPELALKYGMDQGFSRGTHGNDVASFIVKKHREIHEN